MRVIATCALAALVTALAPVGALAQADGAGEPPFVAGEIRLDQTVRGDTRAGLELGAYRNQFWRLAGLRARDRVRVRLLGAGDQAFCAYGPGAAAYGFLQDGSSCTVASARVRRPASFVAGDGPGDYLVGVFGFTDGPYQLRVDRVQHHVALRLGALARVAPGGLVTVRVTGGRGEPLSAKAIRVRLEAEFADGQRRVVAIGSPVAGRVRLRLSPPPDIARYIFEDYPVRLRARAIGSRSYIAAVSPWREAWLG